ncbi:MAG TPA: hypothetical protein DCE41_05005 [Cytophagales bacterium]|nr:hypothetical protein [Cytophagales bacterium]HAA17822.1 hypothetical protein [Cytophagales bacterium]HAP58828.1 hypothetical protein [Cytophagales bacterium]
MKNLSYLFPWVGALLIACGGGTTEDSADTPNENGDPQIFSDTERPQDEEEEREAETTGVSDTFVMDPTYTPQEFAYSVMGARFPDDDPNAIAEWPLAEQDLPIIFFTLAYSPEWYVLISPNDDFEFILQEVKLPSGSPWMEYQAASSVNVYRTAFETVDEYIGEGFTVNTQISGMTGAPDGDGMIPINFLYSAILSYENGEVAYSEAQTEAYNEYFETSETGGNADKMEILAKKYYDLMGDPLDYGSKPRVAQLLSEMGLFPSDTYNELHWIAEDVDGNFVQPMSSEVWYIVMEYDPEYNYLENLDSDYYPVIYQTSEYDDQAYQINSVQVAAEEGVFMTVTQLDAYLEPTENQYQVLITYRDSKPLFTFDGSATLMRSVDAAEFPESDF